MTTTYTTGTGLPSGSGVNQGYTTYTTTNGPTNYISSGSGVGQTYTYTTTGAPTSYVGGTYGTSGTAVLGGSSYGTTYVGGPTTTYVGGPTTTQTYVSGPVTTGYTTTGYTTGYGAGYGTTTATLGHQHVHAEQIPVESRIQYIPFEKKYIEYERVARVERVPYEQEIVEYEEIVHTERIPIEKTITDYYAVETQIEYIPKEIEETIVEYEPIERTWERVQYLPVETQIVHYPEREKYIAGQGVRTVNAGYATSSHVHVQQPTQVAYQTYQSTVPTQVAYQTYQNTVPTQAAYQIAGSSSQYGSGSGVGPSSLAYQTYQSTVPGQAAYQIASSSSQYNTSGVTGGQTFASGAHGTGTNYVYTSGGPIETSTYTSGGYAQPLSTGGYVTADGTHLSNTGNIVSGSTVKNNTSYATNV